MRPILCSKKSDTMKITFVLSVLLFAYALAVPGHDVIERNTPSRKCFIENQEHCWEYKYCGTKKVTMTKPDGTVKVVEHGNYCPSLVTRGKATFGHYDQPEDVVKNWY